MVSAQDTNDGQQHVVYYSSKSLTGPKLRYTHIDKLALAIVLVVQRFHNYIFLRKTTIIADSNAMCHILTKQVLGGKYSCWIVIL